MKNNIDSVTPILKWVGGKREVLPYIKKYYKDLEINNYHEPFFGGGSVYIDIVKTFGTDIISKSFINDINSDLINMYKDVKSRPNEVITHLESLVTEYNQHGFYYIRDRYNGMDREKNKVTKYHGVERSSSLILLNKTCFNGMYRTNKLGLYNVPSGNYKNPKVINRDNFDMFSYILPPVDNITNLNFKEINNISKGDLVYFDPPYHPISKTSSFTEYTGSFNEENQVELFEFFKRLDDIGVYVILSNSNSEFILDLYSEYYHEFVDCSRFINSNGKGRGKVKEFLVIGNTLKNEIGL
jgi:DNA adenine methylase